MASTPHAPQNEVLNQIFQGLRSKNNDVRLQSAQELRRYVRSMFNILRGAILKLLQISTNVVEMSSDAAAKLWEDNINRRLFDLMHSQNIADKFGGLLAIGVSPRLTSV